MKQPGQGIAAIGVLGFLGAVFLMPVTVSTGVYGTTDVANIGLQQRQMLVAIGSLAVFMAGVVLYAAGTVIDAMIPGGSPPEYSADDEAALMEKWGITHDAPGYRFGSFAYTRLASAVKEAERQVAA